VVFGKTLRYLTVFGISFIIKGMKKKVLLFLIFILFLGGLFFNTSMVAKAAALAVDNKEDGLPVYFFWGDDCPHCEDEAEFLASIQYQYPKINFYSFEAWNNEENYKLLLQMSKAKTGKASGSVPFIVIGNETILGFRSAETTGAQIKQLLDIYIITAEGGEVDTTKNNKNQSEMVDYPVIGSINLKNLSLPILTIVLGTLDGFNPCSMWALVVLITLLFNVGSKKKLWLVGIVFIITSYISYFIFLSAWLNLFLFVGYMKVIQILIGFLAISVGGYFAYDFWKNRKINEVVCEVSTSAQKEKVITRLQNVLQKKSLWAVVVGVVLVAFSVNIIEFMCSAGIPAIYAHLALYDFCYMLDDIVILLIAVFTWKLFAGTAKYTKYSHLIGAILLLILGVIMLVNPNLLRF